MTRAANISTESEDRTIEEPLSTAAKRTIEEKSEYLSVNNPFFIKARQGELTQLQIQAYVYNVWHLLSYTIPHLETAKATSEKRNDSELANFFAEKIPGEIGHDQWAKNDLAALGEKIDEVELKRISPAMRALISYVGDLTENNPNLYLAYTTFAEYFTVLKGPELVSNFEANCGVESRHVSCIALHAKIDAKHSAEDFITMDRLLFGKMDRKEFLEAIHHFFELVDQFLTEMTETAH